MNKLKSNLTAVLFLLGIAAGLVVATAAFFSGSGNLRAEFGKLRRDFSYLPTFLSSAENALNQDLDKDHHFIQLYGGIQRLMGRRVVEDVEADYTVIKLDNGDLAFENLYGGPTDTRPHAQAVADFKGQLSEKGIPLLYVQAPQKVSQSGDELPEGVSDYGHENADLLLSTLAELGVDTLDLRPVLEEAAQAPGALPFYFRTDHHWTPEGGFAGYQAVTQRLSEILGYEVNPLYTDPDSYTKITYEDSFLGSQGKRVGTLYTGVDSINLWKPNFETSFTYSVPLNAIERTGPFEESLLFPERVEEIDYFNGNPYTLYAGGDYNLARMTNHLNPDGPRVLLIRDSFSCILAPFLALDCSELITIDLRYFKDNLMDYMDWLDPDMVVVMYCASSTRLPELFQFFGADTKPEFRY